MGLSSEIKKVFSIINEYPKKQKEQAGENIKSLKDELIGDDNNEGPLKKCINFCVSNKIDISTLNENNTLLAMLTLDNHHEILNYLFSLDELYLANTIKDKNFDVFLSEKQLLDSLQKKSVDALFELAANNTSLLSHIFRLKHSIKSPEQREALINLKSKLNDKIKEYKEEKEKENKEKIELTSKDKNSINTDSTNTSSGFLLLDETALNYIKNPELKEVVRQQAEKENERYQSLKQNLGENISGMGSYSYLHHYSLFRQEQEEPSLISSNHSWLPI